ncbi:Pol polyprotein, partial [Mucuna pruriens]
MNLLRSSLDCEEIETVHASSYHMAHCQDGPSQVYLRKTSIDRTDCTVANGFKPIKRSAIAKQLAHHPLADHQPLLHEFSNEHIMSAEEAGSKAELDEWKLWFDGASNLLGNGIGTGQCFPFSATLDFDYTNNMVEYEACATRVLRAVEHQAKKLKVFDDFALVFYQLRREWETRDSKLIPYHNYIMKISECFDRITFHYVPWDENQTANALTTLSSMLRVNQGQEITIHVWHQGATENDKRTLRKLATGFFLNGSILYKRSTDLTLLHCVDDQEAKEIIEEVHEGIFGTHTNGHALARKILKACYYWSKMESDCCQHMKRCLKCQVYVHNIHVAPSAFHNLTSPWPFSMWGLDIIRPIEPKASNGQRFILVAINYFITWVEVALYSSVTKSVVVEFVKRDITCQYEHLTHIITNNGTNLNNKMMTELCEQFKIKHHHSTPYRPKMNGVIEATNKNIKKIVQKMEILPIEVKIPSLRVIAEAELEDAEWIQSWRDQLNLIEEKRLTALCHGQLYQKRIKNAFDKKVRPCLFEEGDLVLRKIQPNAKDSREMDPKLRRSIRGQTRILQRSLDFN